MTDIHNTDPQADAMQHRTDDQHQADNKRRADEQRKIEDQRREDAEKRADEARNASFERDKKRIEEDHKTNEENVAAARKAAEARRKEDERRAELSAPDRVAEDDKRAAMTPEERAKDDEAKGLSRLDQFAEVNPLAGQSQFVILNEPHHTAEFILTEANGQRSRENAYLADPVTVTVGMPLKKSAAATSTQFATYVPAAAGADCDALAMYAGGSLPGQGLRISVIARDAEVNGNLITWGAITAPEQLLGIAQLATHGIIVRL